MLKKFIVMTILLILLIASLNGCISNSNYKENIIGSWISERSSGEEENAVFNFFSNGSFSLVVNVYLNESDQNTTSITLWQTYTINDKEIIMMIEGKKEILEYHFSDNNNIITLIEDNGEETVLLRQ